MGTRGTVAGGTGQRAGAGVNSGTMTGRLGVFLLTPGPGRVRAGLQSSTGGFE